MTEPISSQNRSVYDPSQFGADECDASTASCAPPAAPSAAARTVTIPPVYITGDLGAGASELVRRHDSASVPACSAEKANAGLSCGLAVFGAVGTALSSPTGVGLAVGSLLTAGYAAQCGRDVQTAIQCEEQGLARAKLEAECEARDGILLAKATGGLVCLVTE